jgi:hypothetical protein
MLKWTLGGEPQEKSTLRREKVSVPIDDNVCLQTIDKTTHIEILKQKDREDLCTRMTSREPLMQIGQNPFAARDYIRDIEIQDRFLKGKGY